MGELVKVRMTQAMSGVEENWVAGDERDVPPEHAEAWIGAGIAEAVEETEDPHAEAAAALEKRAAELTAAIEERDAALSAREADLDKRERELAAKQKELAVKVEKPAAKKPAAKRETATREKREKAAASKPKQR